MEPAHKEKIYLHESNSGTNTILIVLVLLIVTAGIIWFVVSRNPASDLPADEQADFQIDVTLPDRSGTSANGEGEVLQ